MWYNMCMRIELTLSTFVPEVRRITRDTSASDPIHQDSDVYHALVDAFRHLYAIRPESRYSNVGQIEDIDFPKDDASLGDFVVSFDDRWRLGILYFAASRCYEADVTDSVNLQLAQTLLQKADAEFQR
jgi:hypothetical protein